MPAVPCAPCMDAQMMRAGSIPLSPAFCNRRHFDARRRPGAVHVAWPEDSPKGALRTAEGFGAWIKDLPGFVGNHPMPARHQCSLSISSAQGYPISTSVPPSRRPTSRASLAIRTPAMATRSFSQASQAHLEDILSLRSSSREFVYSSPSCILV